MIISQRRLGSVVTVIGCFIVAVVTGVASADTTVFSDSFSSDTSGSYAKQSLGSLTMSYAAAEQALRFSGNEQSFWYPQTLRGMYDGTVSARVKFETLGTADSNANGLGAAVGLRVDPSGTWGHWGIWGGLFTVRGTQYAVIRDGAANDQNSFAEVVYPYTAGDTYQLRLTVSGSSAELWINGSLVLTADSITQPSSGRGTTAVWLADGASWSQPSSFLVDDWAVTPYTPQNAQLAGRIAFQTSAPGDDRIYVLDLPGGTPVQVPLPTGKYGLPKLSNDGTWLTFYGGPGGHADIFVAKVDGSEFRAVITGPGDYVTPSFSPDGLKIAFNAVYSPLYTIGRDGSNLTAYPVGASLPRWSPVGNQIAYSNWGFTYESDVFIYDLDARTSFQVTHRAAGQAFNDPAWSPDGTKLAMTRIDYYPTRYSLSTCNVDGTNMRTITSPAVSPGATRPAWSPDGKYVVFESNASGSYDIWAVKADRSEAPFKVYGLPGVDETCVSMPFLDLEGDIDGDGLWNGWEMRGIDTNSDGTIETNLPAMGADPWHKDVFVEVDYMVDSSTGGHSHLPKAEALEKVIDAFANAPVSNPDGTTGIRLHVDAGPSSIMNPITNETWAARSESKSLTHVTSLGPNTWFGDYGWADFNGIKEQHFAPARQSAFHYCIFAHNINIPERPSTSGISKGFPSGDFIVSLGEWDSSVGTVMEQAGTFMHELGHNLSLQHGGDNGDNWKPNFLSIMNYSFQTRGLLIKGLDGNMDYSIKQLNNLDENNLNESVGLDAGASMDNYGTIFFLSKVQQEDVLKVNDPIDWNKINDIEVSVSVDINTSPKDHFDGSKTVLTSYDDWANLVFKGGAIGQLGTEPDVPTETPAEELTREDDAALITRYAVSVGGQVVLRGSPGTLAICQFVVKNIGQFADTYHLNCTDLQGWVDISSVPTEIALDPGSTTTLAVPVEIPASATIAELEHVKLIAMSQSNPNVLDSALTSVFPNAAPISNAGPDQTVYADLSGKALVALDGSASTDADGDEISYIWLLENDVIAEGDKPTVELPVGTHTVKLIARDLFGDGAPDEVTITAVAPMTVYMQFTSQTINLASKGTWVKAHFTMGVGVTVEDIDTDYVSVLKPGGVTAGYVLPFVAADGTVQVEIGFDRASFAAAVGAVESVEVSVLGRLKNGQYFSGSDEVRVLQK